MSRIRSTVVAATLASTLVVAFGGFAGGCKPRGVASFTILASPIEVVASEPAEDEGPGIELKVRGKDTEWIIRTLVRECGARPFSNPVTLRTALQRFITWSEPYLFVREENTDRQAARAAVDHVFKFSGQKVERIGAVSGGGGPPGSQLKDGRFLDVYDRLEFTTLTDHAQSPKFALVMQERGGRFAVNLDETWRSGRDDFERRLRELQALASNHQRRRTPSGQREARALALYCLAFAKYCDRSAEAAESRVAAKAALDSVDDLVEELDTVKSGELAPSRDKVLRANPALLNLFKESPDDPDSAAPSLPTPPPNLP